MLLKSTMNNINNVPEFSKYFRVITPSAIKKEKEEIFYREKYNEIINYIKTLLSNHEDLTFKDYIEPKGAILINVNPGTDIIDYIKVISKSYYLNFIELNDYEILKSPEEFLKAFPIILNGFSKNKEENYNDKSEESNLEKNSEKKILVINQQPIFNANFEDNNYLKSFINTQQDNNNIFKPIDRNLLLIWINYDLQDITVRSTKLYDIFDLFIKIPLLGKVERETVLRDFLEQNSKIVFDINSIVNYTDNWEVEDLKRLIRVGIFKHHLKLELNEKSNEITDILIDLIKSGEYVPNIRDQRVGRSSDLEKNEEKTVSSNIEAPQTHEKIEKLVLFDNMVAEIRGSRISDFMLNQLYENAASTDYNEILLIIDKLNKKEALEDNDRKVLAKFPFILNDTPSIAQINLEKAKKRVDLIKQAFGK